MEAEAEATIETKVVVIVSKVAMTMRLMFRPINLHSLKEEGTSRDTVDIARDTEVSLPFCPLSLVLTNESARSETFHHRFEPLFPSPLYP